MILRRYGRIRGQIDAIQALEEDADSRALPQQATACRAAPGGFIAEMIENHIRGRAPSRLRKS
jgi:DNA-binding FrmR family transcriptional regulator